MKSSTIFQVKTENASTSSLIDFCTLILGMMQTKHNDKFSATHARCIKFNSRESKQSIVESIAKNRDATQTVYNALLELHGPYDRLLQVYSDVTLTRYVAAKTFWLLTQEEEGWNQCVSSKVLSMINWKIEQMMKPGVISAITEALHSLSIHYGFMGNKGLSDSASQKLCAAVEMVIAQDRKPFTLFRLSSDIFVVNGHGELLLQNHHYPYMQVTLIIMDWNSYEQKPKSR